MAFDVKDSEESDELAVRIEKSLALQIAGEVVPGSVRFERNFAAHVGLGEGVDVLRLETKDKKKRQRGKRRGRALSGQATTASEEFLESDFSVEAATKEVVCGLSPGGGSTAGSALAGGPRECNPSVAGAGVAIQAESETVPCYAYEKRFAAARDEPKSELENEVEKTMGDTPHYKAVDEGCQTDSKLRETRDVDHTCKLSGVADHGPGSTLDQRFRAMQVGIGDTLAGLDDVQRRIWQCAVDGLEGGSSQAALVALPHDALLGVLTKLSVREEGMTLGDAMSTVRDAFGDMESQHHGLALIAAMNSSYLDRLRGGGGQSLREQVRGGREI